MIVSKRPKRYTDLKEWSQTSFCYSGLIAYRIVSLLLVVFFLIHLTYMKTNKRLLFLDVTNNHLRLEYKTVKQTDIFLNETDVNNVGGVLKVDENFEFKTTVFV